MSSRTAHQQRNHQQRQKLNAASSYYSVLRKNSRKESKQQGLNRLAFGAMVAAVFRPMMGRIKHA
jgi:hypothetical protein